MKKQITIRLDALHFLHRTLSETGVVSRAEARKQHTAFQCMNPHVERLVDGINALRKKHRENKPRKDPQGNETDNWVIPEVKKEQYEKEINELGATKVEVEFDVESFSVVSRAFDEMFKRQQELEEKQLEKGETPTAGFSGPATMRLIEEVSGSLDGVRDA